jgi:hypothetical protein
MARRPWLGDADPGRLAWGPAGRNGAAGNKGGRRAHADRGQTGKRAIPAGVALGVQAAALAGTQTAQEIAAQWGVSTAYVATMARVVKGLDPEAIATVTRGIPSLLRVATAGFAQATVTALERKDYRTATQTMFGAKLGTEATRWAATGAGEAGGTVLAFIEALGQAGGGKVTVEVGPPPDAPRPLQAFETLEVEAAAPTAEEGASS